MKDNNQLQAKLVQNQMRSGSEVAPAQEKRTINTLIESYRGEFEKVLGKSADVQRFMRICITEVRKNELLKKIAINNPSSILTAIMQMAQLGLDPALPNECFLVPYGPNAQCQLGYKGLMKLALEAAREQGAPIKVLKADIIHENDQYERESGSSPKVVLRPPPFGVDRGDVLGYVAVSKDANGMVNYVEMTKEEVRAHKARYSKAKSGPFAGEENLDAYGLKTVVRRLVSRHLATSAKLGKALELDYVDSTPQSEEGLTVEIEPTDPAPESGAQAVVEKSEVTGSSVST